MQNHNFFLFFPEIYGQLLLQRRQSFWTCNEDDENVSLFASTSMHHIIH